MPLLALIPLFVIVPLVELYFILKVGDAIGIGWTLLLLVADSVLGSLLLRSQGRATWRRVNEALRSGRIPHREVQHGIAVIFGGALLLTPGFLTDVLGLALLLPPTRGAIVALFARRLARRAAGRVARPAGAREYDVEGSATEQPHAAPRRLDT